MSDSESPKSAESKPCPFCLIIEGRAEATIVRRWPDAIAIVPLNPVTEGHLLVLPLRHVRDVAEDPDVSAATMRAAAELATAPCNVITSAGPEATQTVWHLHLHVVPRRARDHLSLPWDRRGGALFGAGLLDQPGGPLNPIHFGSPPSASAAMVANTDAIKRAAAAAARRILGERA